MANSMSGLTSEQLAQMMAGDGPLYMPTYRPEDVYAGTAAQQIARALGGPVEATKTNRGLPSPQAYYSNFDEGQIPMDQTLAMNRPGVASMNARDVVANVPAPRIAANTSSTINAATPLDASLLGLTVGPKPTPASQAIAEILVKGGASAPTGGANRGRTTSGRNGGLVFQNTPTVGAAPKGDPWAGMRIGGGQGAPVQGLVTGNQSAPSRVAALYDRLSGDAQRQALLEQSRLTQNPELAAAQAAGRTSYVSSGDNGALAVNALMPTVSISGKPLRNQ